jgi:subtilisin family serine protease
MMLRLWWLQLLCVGLLLWTPAQAQTESDGTLQRFATQLSEAVSLTLANFPQLQNLTKPSHERAIVFKARPNATEIEKLGFKLLSMPEFHFIAGFIPDEIVDEMEKLGMVEKVIEEAPVYAAARITGLSTTLNSSKVVWAEQAGVRNWGLDRIDQVELPLDGVYWYPESGGEDVNIYVIDTGINVDHEDFEGRARWGKTFLGTSTSTVDDAGHGTMVASMAAGKKYGVAKKANLIAVKILDATGQGTNIDSMRALQWVWEQHESSTNKKTVINMSLGGQADDPLNEVVERIVARGIPVITAAGNGDASGYPLDACSTSPGSAKGVINVGATDRQDRVASFSNYGKCVTLFAPGVQLMGAAHDSKTGTAVYSGTSFAAPLVSGAVAILIGESGPMSPDEVYQRIKAAAIPDRIRGLDRLSPNLLLSISADYSAVVSTASHASQSCTPSMIGLLMIAFVTLITYGY